MGFLHHTGAWTAASMAVCTAFVQASDHRPPAPSQADWQIRRLMAPTSSQRASESRGQVFIYDSLEINQVETALDRNFDRIENMMFIRIHHPPESEDGEVTVDDDDC